MRWHAVVLGLSGVWLLGSALSGFGRGPYGLTGLVAGPLLLLCGAGIQFRSGQLAAPWTAALVGAALVTAPYLFGFVTNTPAAWNAYLLGLLTVVVSLFAVDRARAEAGRADGS